MDSHCLFNWERQEKQSDLQAKRQKVIDRMEGLPPHSHERVELQGVLKHLTNEALKCGKAVT